MTLWRWGKTRSDFNRNWYCWWPSRPFWEGRYRILSSIERRMESSLSYPWNLRKI